LLVEEIHEHQPLAVIGSKYRGYKWREFENQLPLPLLHHLNGKYMVKEVATFIHLFIFIVKEKKRSMKFFISHMSRPRDTYIYFFLLTQLMKYVFFFYVIYFHQCIFPIYHQPYNHKTTTNHHQRQVMRFTTSVTS
jgi:hypothetical protein